MNSSNFYQDLQSFGLFSDFTRDSVFIDLPSDWHVIITDVQGSTDAIEKGKYKDVNTVGAAAIVAARKGMEKVDFPYVFGGDGATLAVPAEFLDSVVTELLALKNLAQAQFQLSMRLGVVPVSELINNGVKVEVGKFELIAGRCIAVFRGGGLSLAEDMVKSQDSQYLISQGQFENADLSGLSCRWNPIPNKRGLILSLLVEARTDAPFETYRSVLEQLDAVFNGDLEQANPVNVDKATYKTVNTCYRDESRYHQNRFSLKFILRCLEIVVAVVVFRFKVHPLIFSPNRYKESMRPHSDYRKFDDMLRMIVDCTWEQKQAIESYLEQAYRKGELYYGLHESENCLMTCYVDDLNDGNHIHFIDGGNGGYAMAAKQLKHQIKQEST